MSRCCRKQGPRPADLAHPVPCGSDEFWRHEQYEGRPLYDRWCLVVQLSDRVDVEWFRAVPPISELGEQDIAVSGIGTIAAAQGDAARPTEGRSVHYGIHVCAVHEASPVNRHSLAGRRARRVGAPRPLGHLGLHRPTRTRPGTAILAAGDLNMIYGATGNTLALPTREKAFWDRVAALGLEFLGPQAPDGWQPSGPQPDVPPDTKNVPTWVRNGRPPEEANRQFDYAIASRGFHAKIEGARAQQTG